MSEEVANPDSLDGSRIYGRLRQSAAGDLLQTDRSRQAIERRRYDSDLIVARKLKPLDIATEEPIPTPSLPVTVVTLPAWLEPQSDDEEPTPETRVQPASPPAVDRTQRATSQSLPQRWQIQQSAESSDPSEHAADPEPTVIEQALETNVIVSPVLEQKTPAVRKGRSAIQYISRLKVVLVYSKITLNKYYRRILNSHYSKPQLTLAGMAAMVFVVGIVVSVQTVRTNHATSAQVASLAQQSTASVQPDKTTPTTKTTNSTPVPETTKPSPQTVGQYAVAPDAPRTITIPSINVNARVRQVSILKNGELDTPKNVYDAAWYDASAKPGQPGATLIDGHVSSWTTHGVFYDIKKLRPGAQIQIQKGDNTTITYRVVRSTSYKADSVDMKSAVTPVTPGKSGLNLITCSGKVKPGTSEFDERIIVYAEQV